MKRYPSYKDSGVEWLGEIPEHWSIKKAKWIFREVSNKNYPNEPLLSATQEHGVVPRDLLENRVMMPMGELVNYKLVEEGNFVISLRSFEGGIEYSKFRGLVSPAYTVLQNKILIEKRFFTYLMKSLHFIQELNKAITGVRDGKNINYKDFTEIYFPIVPNLEQKAIAHFLDHKLEQIEQYIRNKKRLIELLNEQKTAIINRAVTKGINPNAPMKHSGIEWLGEIPSHWEVIKLKFLAKRITDGEHISPKLVSEGILLLSAKDIRDKEIIYDVDKFVSIEDAKQFWLRCKPQLGDVLIVSRGATIGRVAIVEDEIHFCLMGSVILCRLKSEAISLFIYFVLNSNYAQKLFFFSSAASAQPAIYITDIAELAIPIPTLQEQNEIIDYLEFESQKIDLAIAQIEKEIELIQEYRTTLISDAVTGKIDVRGFDNGSHSRNSPKPPELATM